MDGADVAPVNGKVSVRFMEPMEEVNYIDQLRLVAVDHPDNVEVNPDERFLDDPPFASGRVVASADARLPAGAWDGEGRDVLDPLSRRDHKFASGFTALPPYDGFANLHALTLDLGDVKPNAPLRLLMTGYVNYFSATSLYAAWQAGVKEISPYVEAQLPDGTWKRIPGDAGFPAGLERTIVVDLTGKLPAGTRRIRLMTNLQIYWDQVLIDQSANAEARTTEMPLSLATLHFRGYPKQIEGASPGDLDYDYNRRQPDRAVPARARQLHAHGRCDAAGEGHRRPLCDLRQRRRDCSRVRHREAARAARALEARLLLLRQRIREGYGLVGCVAVHRGADAVPWHEHVSVSGHGEISGRCRLARLPVELERSLRLGRAGALVSLRLQGAAFDTARRSARVFESGHDNDECCGSGAGACAGNTPA